MQGTTAPLAAVGAAAGGGPALALYPEGAWPGWQSRCPKCDCSHDCIRSCRSLPLQMPQRQLAAEPGTAAAAAASLHSPASMLAAALSGPFQSCTLTPLAHNGMAPGVPCPHLGQTSFSIQLPEGVAAGTAAAQLATMLHVNSNYLYTVQPEARGPVVTLVAPTCPPSEAALASAAGPLQARHGWSAAGSELARQQATLHHKPLAIGIVLLEYGQTLEALDCEPGSMAAALQLASAGWASLQQTAQREGLDSKQQTSLMLAADTMAAVQFSVLLLPLADHDGFPTLGLYVASVALAAVTSGSSNASASSALAALAAANTPALAWRWVAEHAAPHAGSSGAVEHLRGWIKPHQNKVQQVVAQAASLQLCGDSALPAVLSGCWQQSFFSSMPAGSRLLAAVPTAKRGRPPQLDLATLQEQLEAAGVQLLWGPLEVWQTLAERNGVLLFAVLGGGDGAELPPGLLETLESGAITRCMLIDVTRWHRWVQVVWEGPARAVVLARQESLPLQPTERGAAIIRIHHALPCSAWHGAYAGRLRRTTPAAAACQRVLGTAWQQWLGRGWRAAPPAEGTGGREGRLRQMRMMMRMSRSRRRMQHWGPPRQTPPAAAHSAAGCTTSCSPGGRGRRRR